LLNWSISGIKAGNRIKKTITISNTGSQNLNKNWEQNRNQATVEDWNQASVEGWNNRNQASVEGWNNRNQASVEGWNNRNQASVEGWNNRNQASVEDWSQNWEWDDQKLNWGPDNHLDKKLIIKIVRPNFYFINLIVIGWKWTILRDWKWSLCIFRLPQ